MRVIITENQYKKIFLSSDYLEVLTEQVPKIIDDLLLGLGKSASKEESVITKEIETAFDLKPSAGKTKVTYDDLIVHLEDMQKTNKELTPIQIKAILNLETGALPTIMKQSLLTDKNTTALLLAYKNAKKTNSPNAALYKSELMKYIPEDKIDGMAEEASGSSKLSSAEPAKSKEEPKKTPKEEIKIPKMSLSDIKKSAEEKFDTFAAVYKGPNDLIKDKDLIINEFLSSDLVKKLLKGDASVIDINTIIKSKVTALATSYNLKKMEKFGIKDFFMNEWEKYQADPWTRTKKYGKIITMAFTLDVIASSLYYGTPTSVIWKLLSNRRKATSGNSEADNVSNQIQDKFINSEVTKINYKNKSLDISSSEIAYNKGSVLKQEKFDPEKFGSGNNYKITLDRFMAGGMIYNNAVIMYNSDNNSFELISFESNISEEDSKKMVDENNSLKLEVLKNNFSTFKKNDKTINIDEQYFTNDYFKFLPLEDNQNKYRVVIKKEIPDFGDSTTPTYPAGYKTGIYIEFDISSGSWVKSSK